jgi:hypothetical protein
MSNLIKVKRGTKSSLPTLNVGELGFCSDTNELYIGTASGNVKLAPSSSASGGASIPSPLSANYYFVAPLFTAVSTVALTANRIYAIPFVLSVSKTITTIGITVSTAASGTTVQVGVYSDGGGSPNAALYSTSDLDSGTTGFKTYPNQSWVLNAGTTYWLAIQSSGTPTIGAITAVCNLVYCSGTTFTRQNGIYYSATSYGLPSSLSGVSWTPTTAAMPIAVFGY